MNDTIEENYRPNDVGDLVSEIRERSPYCPPPIAAPAQCGKKTRALFEAHNVQRASFSDVGKRLANSANALAAAKENFANSPTDANLDSLATAKNAHDILTATGIRADPGALETLSRERFYTPELCLALQQDCEALASRFSKSAVAARKAFADKVHAKVIAGEFLDNVGTLISRETYRSKRLVERLEELRNYIGAQGVNAGRMSRGEAPITGVKLVFECLGKDPETTTAEALAEVY